MKRHAALAAVFVVTCATLGFTLGKAGLAEACIDPIAHIRAQDEAVYASTSLHMAKSGGWLTPMFLGRFAFYKPPMLYWLSGLCAKLLGPSPWALRLPSLLSASAIAVLLFGWIWQANSLLRAVSSCSFLLADRIFQTLAQVALTDMIVVLSIVVAMASLHYDPRLLRRRSLWIFAIAVGAAILTKSVAGLLPLFILAVMRVGLRRFTEVCLIATLIAAPWHLYQLLAHTRWFWAEYVLTENFTWAVAAPSQSTAENQLFYYAKRLLNDNPALCGAALLGIPGAVRAKDRLLAGWIGAVIIAFFAFGYRNTSYLLLLIPPLCLLAARTPLPAIFIPLALFSILPKVPPPLPSAAALQAYAALRRPNDLIIVVPDDEFVSATLPIRQVRYCYLDPHPAVLPLPLDFRYLGIAITVPEFNQIAEKKPVLEQRLADFGLHSATPIGTVVLATSTDQLRELIVAHPQTDFFLPVALANFAGDSHYGWNANERREFLLGR